MSSDADILGTDVSVPRMPAPQIPPNWNPLAYPEKGKPSDYSYSYYTQDVVLSGIKKSLNRALSLEAVKWGLEQFYTNRATRTWSWNILLEYSLEAIGPADPIAFLRVGYLKTNYPNEVTAYITAILILAQSQKTNTILFSSLYYPEFKTIGVAKALGSPEFLQATLEYNLTAKNLSAVIPSIIALFYYDATSKKFEKSDLLIKARSMVHASFMKLTTAGQPSYLNTLLTVVTSDLNWKWEARSLKIYLHLAHLICTDSLPKTSFYQQVPADNVEYMARAFIARDWHLFMIPPEAGPYGASQYQIDLSTGEGKKSKQSKEQWIQNISVLVPENPTWKPLSDFYSAQFREKKSNKIN